MRPTYVHVHVYTRVACAPSPLCIVYAYSQVHCTYGSFVSGGDWHNFLYIPIQVGIIVVAIICVGVMLILKHYQKDLPAQKSKKCVYEVIMWC